MANGRKIIQITSDNTGRLYALTDDGMVWFYTGPVWGPPANRTGERKIQENAKWTALPAIDFIQPPDGRTLPPTVNPTPTPNPVSPIDAGPAVIG